MEVQKLKRGPKPKIGTKEALLKAGLNAMFENGFTASGVQEIVDIAQVPKGSFYNYFKSKEDFGCEVIDYYFSKFINGVELVLCDTDIAPLQRLHNFFTARILIFQENGYRNGCLFGNLSLELADRCVHIRQTIAKHMQSWQDLFENCIEQAKQNGSIQTSQDSKALAQFILNGWEGAILRMRSEKNDIALKQFQKLVFEIVLV